MNKDLLQYAKYSGGRQIVWDCTSAENAWKCPTYYKHVNLEGYRDRYKPEALIYGVGYHAGAEAYDLHCDAGASHEEAMDAAILACLPSANLLRGSTDTRRTQETLIRAVIWQAEWTAERNIRTWQGSDGNHVFSGSGGSGHRHNHPGLEVRFEVPIPGTEYRFSGKVDKLADINDELWIVERKTTNETLPSNYFVKRFSPGIQPPGYTWALRAQLGLPIAGTLIEVCQTAVGFNRFQQSFVSVTEGDEQEFLADLIDLTKEIDGYHETGRWPMRRSSCNLYGGCGMRDVCRQPAHMRQSVLEAKYEKREYQPKEGAITCPVTPTTSD